jgi:hypothetical protein
MWCGSGAGLTLHGTYQAANNTENDPDRGKRVTWRNPEQIGMVFPEHRYFAGRMGDDLLGRAPDVAATKADPTAEMVTKFAAAHPRFEELSEDIVFFLDTGRANDLAEAYGLAERFNLAPSEADEVDGGKRAN